MNSSNNNHPGPFVEPLPYAQCLNGIVETHSPCPQAASSTISPSYVTHFYEMYKMRFLGGNDGYRDTSSFAP